MICSIVDCQRPVIARGWCRVHYARWYRHEQAKRDLKCTIPDCTRPQNAPRGCCEMHYRQWRRDGSVQPSAVRVKSACVICGKPHQALGWCTTHYGRWRRHGDPLVTLRRHLIGTPEQRFWTLVDKNGPFPEPGSIADVQGLRRCYIWTGRVSDGGYGLFDVGRGHVKAHRFSFEIQGGTLRDGLVLDHLCRRTLCVRASHLEQVTDAVNISRARPFRKRTA